MGKGPRNKANAGAKTSEVPHTGASSSQQVEANIGNLNDSITNLLGVMKNMSMQLDEISSTKKGMLNKGKNADANGNSTLAGSVPLVGSELDVVGEFHNLKQTSSVAEYQEKFEELRDLMMKMNYGLTEGYFISSFLSGLKQDIRCSVGNRKPETLYHAFNLARIQETAIEVMKKKLISSDMQEQYLPSKSVQEFVSCENLHFPSKSVQAFVTHNEQLKFGAYVGKKEITVIISTGIEYSFIDSSLAIHAGCKVEEAEPLQVIFVLGGYKAVSSFRCPRFQWMMQGQKFAADLRIVELKACDMVLGADWVHYNNTLTFSREGISLVDDGNELMLYKRESAK